MPSLPVDTSDIYNQFGVSPKDYFIDPETNTIKRKELPLPVEILEPLVNDFQVSAGSKIGNRLFGTGGEERFQTWPERMVRSGSTIAGDVFSGAVPIESPTGYPGSVLPVEQSMEPNVIGKALGIGNFTIPAAGSEIGRTQDLAGLAGMSSIPLAPKGALGAIGGKFYSTLENTIAGSKVQKATPEQWNSYLKNQPGVKPEELEFSLQGLGDGVVTKEQLAQHVVDNGIKFGEKWNQIYDKLPDDYTVHKIEGGKNFSGQQMPDTYYVQAPNGRTNKAAWNTPEAAQDAMLRNLNENGGTKYSSYQLPGGENYRELLMTVPEKQISKEAAAKQFYETYGRTGGGPTWEDLNPAIKKNYLDDVKPYMQSDAASNYKSSHWDEPNVLAHIRMNDREVPGVGKTLHVEEIQSDWHQAGRKQGYKQEYKGRDLDTIQGEIDKLHNEFRSKNESKLNSLDEIEATWQRHPELRANIRKLIDEKTEAKKAESLAKEGVPNAPFKKTWDELALKRVLSEAATKGYDAVSWTPGEAQAARYDLSKHYDNITATKRQDGTYNIAGTQKGHKTSNALADRVTEDKLANSVGKELAEKIIKDNKEGLTGAIEYSGVDLKVGGEGMKAFYDTMLPAKANALIKKMGGKVEYSTDVVYPRLSNKIGEKPEETRIPIIKITPQMRENINNKGFPLYSSGVPIFTPVDHDPHKMTPIDYNPFTNSKAM